MQLLRGKLSKLKTCSGVGLRNCRRVTYLSEKAVFNAMKAYFGLVCCNISKNAAGFINCEVPGQLLSVSFRVDSCKALEP